MQFPFRLAWAHTVHKAQGQTLFRVSYDARLKPFCHGMTYVGCSRVKSPGDIRILTNDGDSTLGNIVYKKLLQSGPIISDVFKKNDQTNETDGDGDVVMGDDDLFTHNDDSDYNHAPYDSNWYTHGDDQSSTWLNSDDVEEY